MRIKLQRLLNDDYPETKIMVWLWGLFILGGVIYFEPRILLLLLFLGSADVFGY